MSPKISHIQLRGLIVSIMIGVGVLSMPSPLVEHMGSDGWIAILMGGLLALLAFFLYYNIFRLYPDKDFFQIGRATVGKSIFNIFIAIFIAYNIVLLSLTIRTLGELIKIFILQTTPLEIIVLTFTITATYLASYEIDKISRASYFIYPIIILFTLITILVALPGSDISNLLPAFRTDMTGMIRGLGTTAFSFLGVEIVLLAIPYVEQKEKVFRTGVYAIGIVTAIYLLTFIMTLVNFSQEQIISQNYPVLVLIRQLDMPWLFLENLDGLVMSLWILVVFATIVPAYFAVGKYSSKLFTTKKHSYFILGVVPIIYFIAMMPENFIHLMEDLTYVFYIFGVLSALVIPLIILIVGLIRRKVLKK